MSYNGINSTESDPFAPLVSSLFKRMIANPLGIANGDTDAPYNVHCWHPYNGVTVADGNDGTIYDFAVDGAVAYIESPNFAAGYSYGFLFENLNINTGAVSNFNIDGYSSVLAGWLSIGSILTGLNSAQNAAGVNGGPFVLYKPLQLTNVSDTAVVGGVYAAGGGVYSKLPAGSTPPTANSATDTTFLRARFHCGGITNFGAGTVKMLRRKEYW